MAAAFLSDGCWADIALGVKNSGSNLQPAIHLISRDLYRNNTDNKIEFDTAFIRSVGHKEESA